MQSNELRNTVTKMYDTNRNASSHEINRLASIEQRNTTYRRNGTLNFGARQMVGFEDLDYYTFGSSGGSVIVGV